MKVKSTKSALLMSFTSLLLCFAMLIGTTFAWFTDSVTSGVNKIQAGNLDIEVTHSNAKVAASENKSIAGETTMFPDKNGNAMLWEPGAVSYETITVKNVGTLAFKYNLALNITDFNAVKDTNPAKTLKDVLKVMVLTTPLTSVTRDSVANLDWTGNDVKTLDQFKKDGGKLYPTGTQDKASEETFQVIVYWQPTDNDNQWNVNNGKTTTDGQPLFIEFGINVIATQLEHEFDSFGNDYDHVDLPALPQSINKTYESAKITTTINADGTVNTTKVDGTDLGDESVQVVNKSTNTGVGTVTSDSVNSVVIALVNQVGATSIKTVDSSQDSIIYIDVKTEQAPTLTEAVYDINLSAKMHYTDAEGKPQTVEIDHLTEEQLGHKLVVVELDLGPNLKNVKVNHADAPMAPLASKGQEQEGFFYDKVLGKLTIKSKSFSPFKVTYENDKNVDMPRAYVTTYNKDNPVPAGTGYGVSFPYQYSAKNLTGGFSLSAPAWGDAELDDIFLFDAFEDDADAQAMKALFGKLGLSTSDTDQKLKSTLNDTAKVDAAIAKLDPSIQERIKQIVDSRKGYLNWIADYTISFDDAIDPNSVALWGYYPAFGELGFANPIALEKGQEIPLLGTVFDANGVEVFNMNYLMICGYVRQFACGVSNLSNANIGKTITVSLKLFPVDENGVKLADATPETVCTINYTFDRVNVPQ